MNSVLVLHSNCILVTGTIRAIICDLQKHRYYSFDSKLSELFLDDRVINNPNETIISKNNYDNFLLFLENEGLAFWCDSNNVKKFPKLSLEWDFPAYITNCILDGNSNLWYFSDKLIQQLEDLQCSYIELRFFDIVDTKYLHEMLTSIQESHIQSIDILVKANINVNYILDFVDIAYAYSKIRCITIHSGAYNRLINKHKTCKIIELTQNINDENHCGIIHERFFTINMQTFTEAQEHNSCLNRKISIDKNGYIKNCPSMNKKFGSILDTNLKDVIQIEDFTKYWHISKNDITICKSCEFRYICTDCRAYLENPEDIYSKPLKCGYDPSTNKWENWSDNPLKKITFINYLNASK